MTTLATKSVRRVSALLLAPTMILVASSCSDLSEQPHDALTTQNAFHTDAEILAGVAGVYATFRGVQGNGRFMAVEELTTDVLIVPTRGSDWYDNGEWLDMHNQKWTANSSGTLDFINGSWNDMFGAIAKENLMIDVITKAASGAKGDTTLAELRTIRAWDYYMLMDMFGGVPLVTTTELKQYPRVTRDSIFRFIEAELLASRNTLPKAWPAAYYGRVTQGAANAILATLYLNAGFLSKDVTAAGVVSATAYNSCAGITVSGPKSACQAAIDAATAVISSNVYTLNTDWFKNFSQDNQSSTENIFVVVNSSEKGIGSNWPHRTLHYNQLQLDGGPWNGFATTAETFNSFPASDDRRGMWLFGQQYSFDTKLAVNDRTNKPLVFTATIADANAATEAEGVRFNKFPPDPSVATGNSESNDFPFFRLAEMYLIRAEAENELGGALTVNALADLRVVHDRHDAANPITATTQAQIRDAILKERLLEFSAEGKRRTDLIRHGKFTSWTEATLNGVSTNPNRGANLLLFPIPAPQLASNPQLTQNPGY